MKTKPSLEALIAPMSKEEFCTKHWPNTPVHIKHPPQHLLEMLGVPELENFHTLERVWRQDALILPKHGGDEFNGIPVQGPAIKRLFECGMPMFLHRPELAFPELQEWIEALRYDLGIPESCRVLCSTHASPGDTTTHTHFDDALSFIVQLHGTKKWWLAPNEHFPYPTGRHSVALQNLDGKMAPYAKMPMPTKMPEGAVEYELNAGSVLFVPTGYWHSTQGIGESLALMFVILNHSWAHLAADAVVNLLNHDPEWRKFAVGGKSHNPAFRAQATAHLEMLLKNLPSRLAALKPEAFTDPTYQRVSETRYEVLADGGVRFESIASRAEIKIEGEERKIFDVLCKGTGVTSRRALVESGFEPQVVAMVLDALVEAEYLRLV